MQAQVPGNLVLPVRISLGSLSHLFYKMHEEVSVPPGPPRESISLYDLKHNGRLQALRVTRLAEQKSLCKALLASGLGRQNRDTHHLPFSIFKSKMSWYFLPSVQVTTTLYRTALSVFSVGVSEKLTIRPVR